MMMAKPGELVVRVHRPLAGAAVVLDHRAARLERGRGEAVEVEPLDPDDVVGLLERGLEVAPVELARTRSGSSRPRRGGAAASVVERVLRVDDDGERLVVDLDELGGVARELARARGDRGDRIAEVAHLADRERVVLDSSPAAARAGRTGRSSAATSSPISDP